MSETFDPRPNPHQQLHRIFDGGDTALPLALLVARYTLDTLAEARREELPDGFALDRFPQAVPLLARAWLKAMRELYPTDERAGDDAALVAYGPARDRWAAAYVELLEEGREPLAELGDCPSPPTPAYLSTDTAGRATLDYQLATWLRTKLARRASPKRGAKHEGFDPAAKILRATLAEIEKAPSELRDWSFTYLDAATGARHLLDPPAALVTVQGEVIDNGEPDPDEQLDLGLFDNFTDARAAIEATLRDSDLVTKWAANQPPPPEAYAHLPAELRAKLLNRPTRPPALIAIEPALLRAERFATVARCAWAVSVRGGLHDASPALAMLLHRPLHATLGQLHRATYTPDNPTLPRSYGGALSIGIGGKPFARLEANAESTLEHFLSTYGPTWFALQKSLKAKPASDKRPIGPLLDPLLTVFLQKSTHLWNRLSSADQRAYLKGRVFPALRFKGFKGLAAELGMKQNEVPLALELLRTLTLERQPDGSLFPQLLTYTDNRATGELLVYLFEPLLPKAATTLNLTDARLVPHFPIPHFEELTNQYRGGFAVATRALAALFRDRNGELSTQKGLYLPAETLLEILHQALGPSKTPGAKAPAARWLAEWLEALLTGDRHASPVLERVGPDLYHIHRDHIEARAMLHRARLHAEKSAFGGKGGRFGRIKKKATPKPPKA